MRTLHIHKDVYTFDELSASAKQRARDWYRQGLEFDADCIIDDAKTIGKVMGWDIDSVNYSGFCSQGDGAQFTGTWRVYRVQPIEKLDVVGDEELTRIVEGFQAYAVAMRMELPHIESAAVAHDGHYQHEMCTHFEMSYAGGEGMNDDLPEDAEETFKELSRDFMRWIYDALEKEYEYTQSDEYADEGIEANSYEFDENGRIA
jgi:hypothetical protein